MSEEEFYKKEDLLETLEMLVNDLKDMKDDYYRDAILSLKIELEQELEEKRASYQEENENEKKTQLNDYYDTQL